MKSEPGAYSIDDLESDGITPWDGIRNYQARNFMRDQFCVGDAVLFYHSNANPPGVVGVARVASTPYPDHTALDKKSAYHDPRATKKDPIWIMVDVAFKSKFPRLVPLEEMRREPKLSDMLLIKKGVRLSIQPVTKRQFDTICRMSKEKAAV